MPISEILIVYLALGAPLAVYKYLETRGVSGQRRFLVSLATFFFWIPFAIRLSVRHLTNASNNTHFVSPVLKKSSSRGGRNRLEAARAAVIEAGCRLSIHDVREVIERYVGLSEAAAVNDGPDGRDKATNFLEAAGRSGKLGAICLSRRERNRMQRHLDDARQSFLDLFAQLAGKERSRVQAIRRGVELALVVGDIEVADHLTELETHTWSATGDEETRINPRAQNLSINAVRPATD